MMSENSQNPENGSQDSGGILGFFLNLIRLGGQKLLLAILALLSLALVLYFTMSGDGLIKTNALRAEKSRLEVEIRLLEVENVKLKQKIERIKSDPGYMEDEARRKLGLVKPGETIYRLSEEPDWEKDKIENADNPQLK